MRVQHWVMAASALLAGGAFATASELRYREPTGELLPIRRDVLRVGLEVLVDGQPVRTVVHGGRTYLPVPRVGAEFTVRVWNDGPRRITAVVSVDGLSVIDSRPASEQHPGYLVDPGGSVRILGWRRDRDTVAAFRFVAREESYASRLGYPENVGVIGLVAIEEYAHWPQPRIEKRAAGEPAPQMLRAIGSIGTGYGLTWIRPLTTCHSSVATTSGPSRSITTPSRTCAGPVCRLTTAGPSPSRRGPAGDTRGEQPSRGFRV
jgi:hypothetical protein